MRGVAQVNVLLQKGGRGGSGQRAGVSGVGRVQVDSSGGG